MFPDGRLADDPQKGILQRIFDLLGFFKRPESQEEAATYANRQERFNETVSALQKGSDELKSKAEWVPFLGPVTDISQGAVKKDRTQVVLGMLWEELQLKAKSCLNWRKRGQAYGRVW